MNHPVHFDLLEYSRNVYRFHSSISDGGVYTNLNIGNYKVKLIFYEKTGKKWEAVVSMNLNSDPTQSHIEIVQTK